jgi:hypothetical protein
MTEIAFTLSHLTIVLYLEYWKILTSLQEKKQQHDDVAYLLLKNLNSLYWFNGFNEQLLFVTQPP